jgi:uncharacterized protein (TIGR02300 family)
MWARCDQPISLERTTLAKPEWGTKRLCQSCGAKFYDLMRTPITCPKCAAVFHVETETRRRPKPAPEPVKKRKEEEVVDAAEVATEGVEAEDVGAEDVLEDASDLGGDEAFEIEEGAVEKEP